MGISGLSGKITVDHESMVSHSWRTKLKGKMLQRILSASDSSTHHAILKRDTFEEKGISNIRQSLRWARSKRIFVCNT